MYTMTATRGDQLTDAALDFATVAHAGQVRKGSGKPYICHPARVATRIAQVPGVRPAWIAAAVLHDTIEDCGVTAAQLLELFGPEVADLVQELTNPSKQHPDLPRAQKKAMDRAHAATMSPAAKMIKMADRTDNLREGTTVMGAEWLEVYIGESKALAAVLTGVETGLEQELAGAILAAEDSLHATP